MQQYPKRNSKEVLRDAFDKLEVLWCDRKNSETSSYGQYLINWLIFRVLGLYNPEIFLLTDNFKQGNYDTRRNFNDNFLKQFENGAALTSFLEQLQKCGIGKVLEDELDAYLESEKHQKRVVNNAQKNV